MTDERVPFEIGIAEIINSFLLDVHTSMPGQVISFDSATQTIEVQPCLKRKFNGSDDAVNLPVLQDVPVVFPGSGDYWITFDIKKDSYVLLVFNERSLDRWIDQGGIVDPAKPRKFALSDCIAIAGVLPNPDALGSFDGDAIAIRNRDNDIFVKINSGGVSVEAGGGTVDLDSSTGQLDVNGNFTVDK